MKFMNRLLTCVVALGLSTGVGAAEFTMRMSHHFPPQLNAAKLMEQFAKDVKEGTNGRVEVQIFGSAQLYKPNQEHAAVATGKIESAFMSSFTMAGAVPEINVLLAPFLLSGIDVVKKFPESEAAQLLDEKLRAKGLVNLGWMFESTDIIFTSASKPLVKPEDFKGVKIRGLSKLFDESLVAMGAAPVAMPGSEVYQALQTGVIDAGLTNMNSAFSRKYYEVQKFGTITNMNLSNEILVVNPKWWDSLPPDIREVIDSAAKKAEQNSMPSTAELNPAAIQRLRDSGMTITILTPEQDRALADVMQPAFLDKFRGVTDDADKLIEHVKAL